MVDKIPGVLWTTVFLLLTLVPALIEQEFGGWQWTSLAIGILGIAAKVWLVYKPADAPEGVSFEAPPVEVRSNASRVLFG